MKFSLFVFDPWRNQEIHETRCENVELFLCHCLSFHVMMKRNKWPNDDARLRSTTCTMYISYGMSVADLEWVSPEADYYDRPQNVKNLHKLLFLVFDDWKKEGPQIIFGIMRQPPQIYYGKPPLWYVSIYYYWKKIPVTDNLQTFPDISLQYYFRFDLVSTIKTNDAHFCVYAMLCIVSINC